MHTQPTPLHAPDPSHPAQRLPAHVHWYCRYRGLMEQLVRYRHAFHWFPEHGGRAFDATIASLRRRYMNLHASYY